VLEDDQAVADLKLLLKLNYTSSFIRDEGVLLPRATRLRLLVLANAFEIDDYVRECLESLGEGLALEEAINCLAEIPEEVRGHEAMEKLRLQVIKSLVAGIDEVKGGDDADSDDWDDEEAELSEEAKEKLKAAGDALAEALGPVGELYI
jgi:hypothetical protein